MIVNVLGNLRIHGLSKMGRSGSQSSDLPSVMQEEGIIYHNGALWSTGMISGMKSWIRITSPGDAYIHTQGSSNILWTCNHNLSIAEGLSVVVYNSDSTVYTGEKTITFVSDKQLTIQLPAYKTGFAVIGFIDIMAVKVLAAQCLKVGSSVFTDVNGVPHVNGVPLSVNGHEHTFAELSNKPTTVDGYGITDAVKKTQTLALVGDVTGSTNFANGETSINAVIPASGVQAGTYGSSSKIPVIQVNAKGQAVGASQVDISLPATQISSSAGWKYMSIQNLNKLTNGSAPTTTVFRGGLYAMRFSHDDIESIYGSFVIPPDYKPGTSIYFQIHFANTSSNPSGNVYWRIEFSSAKPYSQDVFASTTTTINMITSTSGATSEHKVAESQAVYDSSFEPGSLVIVRVYRDGGSNIDTSSQSVFLLDTNIYYQSDRDSIVNRFPPYYS